MKCPKCDYLGFETGDRCKNCGYDFSLALAPPQDELPLHAPEPFHRDADRWLNQLEARLDIVRPAAMTSTESADPLGGMSLDSQLNARGEAPVPSAPPPPASARVSVQPAIRQIAPRGTPALPLFHPGGADVDEPLIKVPAAPRPPLAVRRTPDKPRLRTVAKPVRRIQTDSEREQALAFSEDIVPALRAAMSTASTVRPVAAALELSGPVRRITAAIVDHLILLSIDAVVVYFTFRIAGLPFSSWQAIPLVPLALFLLMVKGAYFCVFTMVGGQTVGKMATGIRVVGENDRDVEPARAVQRTLTALASVATVGIGFAPVLFSDDRRALHDRVAGTRVVGPVHE